VKELMRLYPAWWRDRYGREMSALLDDLPRHRRARLAIDLLRGALDARFSLIEEAHMVSPANRSIRRGILIGLGVWAALSVEIYLSNVVFPTRKDDDTVPVLLSYLAIFAALAAVGYLAGRSGTTPAVAAVSGAVTGGVIGVLTIGTFMVVDNVWLDIVSQQPTKIDGLARSGGTSMREFINAGLVPGFFVLGAMLAGFGAVLALGGAFVAYRRTWRA
jgi:hypothetical protein